MKIMKSRLRLALLLSLVAFVLSATIEHNNAVTACTSAAKAVLPALEHSFGVVKPGTPLSYTFKISNAGTDKLEITSVSPSCGCTTSNYDKVIAPGETGSVTLSIQKTENYKGEIIKTATVTTNDPDHARFTLTLRAQFQSE